MTDDTVLDGKLDESGGKGGQPQPSEPQGQPSADVATLQKEIDELRKLYNGIKKSEDKINARVEKRVSDSISQIERIAALAKSGKSSDEIEERLLLDEIIRERKSNPSPPPTEGTGQRGQGPVDVQDVAKQLNLDMNDKDIADAVATGNLMSVMKVAISKASTPSAGPEDQPLATGGASHRSEKTPAQLEQDYQKELSEIVQHQRGDQKIRSIATLKAKYRKEGLDKY